MPTTKFVTAWRKDNGEKTRVPKRWLDHPTLGEPFTTTEPKGTATRSTATPPATTRAADAAAKEK
jgi:hypothetical protein